MIDTSGFNPVSEPNDNNFPNDLLVYAHMALDSYSGGGKFALVAENRAPFNWTIVADDTDLDPEREASFFEATAYQNDLTGDVVIAFRGTDNPRELIDTSIPLGAAIDEGGLVAAEWISSVNDLTDTTDDDISRIYTASYLKTAWEFYKLVRDLPDVGSDNITFTGHSLGGIVAGYIGAATGKRALAFASGPHNEIFERPLPIPFSPTLDQVARSGLIDIDLLPSPDPNAIINLRVDGELLQEAIDAAKTGAVLAAFSGLFFDLRVSAISAIAYARWSDAERWGLPLPELDAGPQFSSSLEGGFLSGNGITDAEALHSMSLHFLLYYADVFQEGKFSNFKETNGFLEGLYDEDLAAAVDARFVANENPTLDMPGTRGAGLLFADIVLSAASRPAGGDDLLKPLLEDVHEKIHLAMRSDHGELDEYDIVGAGLIIPQRILVKHLSEIAIEHAAIAALPMSGQRPYGDIFELSDSERYLSVDLNGVLFGDDDGGGDIGVSVSSLNLTAEADTSPYGFYDDSGSGERGILAQLLKVFPYESVRDRGLTSEVLTLFVGEGTQTETINGADVPTTFLGGAGDDIIVGGSARDLLFGNDGDDILAGGDGNDLLIGGRGNDRLDGGAGSGNTAVYRGDRNEYSISTTTEGEVIISHGLFGTSADGRDTLLNVQTARFADGLFALPSAPPGPTLIRIPRDFVRGEGDLITQDWTRTGDLSYAFSFVNDGEFLRPSNLPFFDEETVFPAFTSQFNWGVEPRGRAEFGPDELIEVRYFVPQTSPFANLVTFSPETVQYLSLGQGVDSRGGIAFGDPHLLTLDNVAYDFQAGGDFILVRATEGDPLEVQARFRPISSAISVVDAVATQIGDTVVAIESGANGVLTIDGVSTDLASGDPAIVVDGGTVGRQGNRITVDYGNGDGLIVDVFSSFLGVAPQPSLSRAPGTLEGLLGDADGDPVNDFVLQDGTVLTTPVPIDVLYGAFAESWLVPDGERLLPGPAAPFAPPDRIVTIDSLPPDLLAEATGAVDAAGIENETLRNAAILDFALTGDEEFITAAQTVADTFDPLVETVAVDPVFKPLVLLTGLSGPVDEGGDEAARTLSFTVTRAEPTAALEVAYSVVGAGTDPADAADFSGTLPSGVVRLDAGDDTSPFSIVVADDQVDEPLETFDVVIGLSDEAAETYELLISSVRVSIADDDEPSPIEEIVGTPGRDTLVGTDAPEILRGLGGPLDLLTGNGGNDIFDLSGLAGNGNRDVTRILDYEIGFDEIVGLSVETISRTLFRSDSAILFPLGSDRDQIVVTSSSDGDLRSLDDISFISSELL